MSSETSYDAAIIGGGLAGLSTAILLAKQGFSVILFEKEVYPFQKVCGEYISLESWNFISDELGLKLSEMNLPVMKKLYITSPNGTELRTELPLGGFGISRYKLDNELKNIAELNGVTVMQHCKADEIVFDDYSFTIHAKGVLYESDICCGSYGKRSNLDIKLERSFTKEKTGRLNNYIGIKYHIISDLPHDEIALHNFKDGYCGISKIEDDKYCLCYLTKAENLKRSGNSIEQMEQTILSENAALKAIFESSQKLDDKPVSISQISFSSKTQIEDHTLMLGDAAGMITPLCGNGMSIAFHTAKLAAAGIAAFLSGDISRAEMEKKYTEDWNANFRKRLRTGRMVQYFFGKKMLTNFFVSTMKLNKSFAKKIIGLTHGKPF
jgi:flavin-dependent dehydrogenase